MPLEHKVPPEEFLELMIYREPSKEVGQHWQQRSLHIGP